MSSLFVSTLWKALFVAYGWPYAVAGILILVQDCLAVMQPQFLRWLLSYISRYQSVHSSPSEHKTVPSSLEGFTIAFVMFFAALLQSITLNQVC